MKNSDHSVHQGEASATPFHNSKRDGAGNQRKSKGISISWSGISFNWSNMFRYTIFTLTIGIVSGMVGWKKFADGVYAEKFSELYQQFGLNEDGSAIPASEVKSSNETTQESSDKDVPKAIGIRNSKVVSPKTATASPEAKASSSETTVSAESGKTLENLSRMFNDVVNTFYSMTSGKKSTDTDDADNSIMEGRRVAQVTSDFNVRTTHHMTAKALNSVLGGVLKGKGEMFIEIGKKYGISPAFIAGISMHECTNGTSRQAKELNNVMGVMDGKMPKKFDSVESCVDYMTSKLKKAPCYSKSKTVAQFQKVYCPIGANNDPSKLNKYWKEGVVDKMNLILEKDMAIATVAENNN